MKRNDLSRALVAFDQDSTIVAVVELSLKAWLVSGLVPGVMRQPLKKQPADPDRPDERAVARYGGLTGASDTIASGRSRSGTSASTTPVAACRADGVPAEHGSAGCPAPGRCQPWPVPARAACCRSRQARTTDGRRDTRKIMIPACAGTALARKLLIALWRYVTTGELPQGVVLKAA